MNRPTLAHCQARIAAFVAEECPEDHTTDLNQVDLKDGSTLTVLTVFWEGRKPGDVPREARLSFGLDGKLLMVQALDPGRFEAATEEGFTLDQADLLSTCRLAGLDALWAYLRSEPYEVIRA